MEPVDKNTLARFDWIQVVARRSEQLTQVLEIHTDGIVTTGGDAVLWEDAYGIALTTDWLEAAGFIRVGDKGFRRKDFACTIIPHEGFTVEVNGAPIAGLRCVHELQHLYAAIKQCLLTIPASGTNA